MRAIKILSIAATARLAASATGPAFDVTPYDGEGRFVLDSSPTEGAGQTSTTKLQHSADGKTWEDTGLAFAPVTNANASHQVLPVNVGELKRFVRAADTLSNGAAVARSVQLVAKKRYGG